jgi:hypothetical protein
MSSPVLARRHLLAGAAAVIASPCLAITRVARATSTGRNVIGRFSTTYETRGAHRPRAANVEIAASAVDGATIAAGGMLSFNAVVGERAAAYGFQRSVVLRDGLLAEGTGGGACQVASTLHAAALLAGLDIVTRTPHSRPSAYIRMGLDATVAFPEIDLRVRNPRVDGLTVRARADRGALTVWFEATGPMRPRVSIATEILERTPFERTVVRDKAVPDDEVHVRIHGIPGYRVLRSREVDLDGVILRDSRTDAYPPVAEVVVANPSLAIERLDLPRPEETPEGTVTPPRVRDEPLATKPAVVQLYPSTRVVIDNGDA